MRTTMDILQAAEIRGRNPEAATTPSSITLAPGEQLVERDKDEDDN